MDFARTIPGLRCQSCGELTLPPQYVCTKCGATHFAETTIPGKGKVFTYTTIRVAPQSFQAQVPYHVLVVQLTPELRVSARLAVDEGENIQIGQTVVLERIDDTGYWFRPGE